MPKKKLSIYEIARKRAIKKRKFQQHLVTYVAVMALLIFINITSGTDHLWFIYPALGWGIGIIAEYYEAYIAPNQEDKAIQKEMAKLEANGRMSTEDYFDLSNTKKADSKKGWKESDLV